MVTKMTLGTLLSHIELLELRVKAAKEELQAAKYKLLEIQQNCVHEDAVVTSVRVSSIGTEMRHFHCKDCDLVVVFWPETEGYEDPITHMRESEYP